MSQSRRTKFRDCSQTDVTITSPHLNVLRSRICFRHLPYSCIPCSTVWFSFLVPGHDYNVNYGSLFCIPFIRPFLPVHSPGQPSVYAFRHGFWEQQYRPRPPSFFKTFFPSNCLPVRTATNPVALNEQAKALTPRLPAVVSTVPAVQRNRESVKESQASRCQ